MNTTQPTLSWTGAVELSHWGLLRAKGNDAASFLHGQLSNDFKLLDGSLARMAAFCSPKGRILASLLGWKVEPHDIWLSCHRSVLAPTLKRLSMFVLRADCRLSEPQVASGDEPAPRIWGLVGNAASMAMSRGGDLPVWGHRRLPHHHSLIRLPTVAGLERALWIGPTPPEAMPLGLDSWRWLEVQSGIPVIEAATSDQFVPQMINFEVVGGVNFQKGCYPGQEVVARSQYRGSTKRRMFLFEIDANTPAALAGQEVFHADDPGQPAGMVVNSAPRPEGGGWVLLAEVKLAALEGSPLHLGSLDGPILCQKSLPYEVPVTNEA